MRTTELIWFRDGKSNLRHFGAIGTQATRQLDARRAHRLPTLFATYKQCFFLRHPINEQSHYRYCSVSLTRERPY